MFSQVLIDIFQNCLDMRIGSRRTMSSAASNPPLTILWLMLDKGGSDKLHIISSLSTPNIAILSGTLILFTLHNSVMRLP